MRLRGATRWHGMRQGETDTGLAFTAPERQCKRKAGVSLEREQKSGRSTVRFLVCDEVEAELCHGGEYPRSSQGPRATLRRSSHAPLMAAALFLLFETLQLNPHHRRSVRWPSGPRRQVKVTLTSKFLVLERGREFESHSYQYFFLLFCVFLFCTHTTHSSLDSISIAKEIP